LAPPPRSRIWRIVRGLIMLVLLHLSSGSGALAQADPFGWFTHLFQPPSPTHVVKSRTEIHRAAPRTSWARPRSRFQANERSGDERPSERPRARSTERASEKGAEKSAEKPPVTPTYFIAVLGDSLAQLLEQGLSQAFVDRPEVAILRKGKENSGLVREDFYDWIKATRSLLDSGEKIDFAVMMIGSNDRQTLRDDKGAYEPRSPQWEDAYTHRIETIAAMFRDKKIPFVWVGLPVLKNERLNADATAFNEFYREYAEKAGAVYIDIWEAFGDEAGEYSANGPDINGQIVRLRSADGVHFTKAGARKLAHFVEPEIRRNLDEARLRENPDRASETPADAGLPAANEIPHQPENDSASEPSAEAPSQPAPRPVKPVAGPILPLTGPVLAPGGALATRTKTPVESNAKIQIEQILKQEEALDQKSGRSDNFSWPRP
jgi:hypothetical protein